jgi:hypothetical protein
VKNQDINPQPGTTADDAKLHAETAALDRGKLDGEQCMITLKTKKKNGRHDWTRTSDLYRVNLLLLNIFNNLTGLLGLPRYL